MQYKCTVQVNSTSEQYKWTEQVYSPGVQSVSVQVYSVSVYMCTVCQCTGVQIYALNVHFNLLIEKSLWVSDPVSDPP